MCAKEPSQVLSCEEGAHLECVVSGYEIVLGIEDQKQAEKEFRRLIDVLPQYFCVYGANAEPLYANDALLDFFGFTLDDFRADDFQIRAFHPDDVQRVQAVRKEAIGRGEGWEVEARILRKDGQYRWFLIRGKPFRDEDGKIVRWFSSGTDIEDRKRAQREVEQIVEAVPQHLIVLSADGRRIYANQIAHDYHGLSLDQFLVVPIAECFHPDDLENYKQQRDFGMSRGEPWEVGARLLSKDGQYRWFLIRGNPFRNEQGTVIRWYLARTDIEERKQAEEALRRSEARLKLLLDLTNKLVTKLELRDLLAAVAANIRQLMQCDLVAVFLAGSDPDKLRVFVVDFPEGKDFLGREFRHTAGEPEVLIQGSLAGMVFRSGKTWRGNAADVAQLGLERDPGAAEGLKNGCVLPVICCNRVLGVLALGRKNENPFTQDDADFLGQVAGQVAVAVDNALVVEARKRAEIALRQSESYLAEAQALSHTGSWAHDLIHREITYWSAEAYRIFGFDPNNGTVTWKQAHSRIHPEDVKRFDETLEGAIRGKRGAKIDFRLLLPDGAVKHVYCVSRPLSNATGEVVGLFGTNMDVTEQFAAKAALEKAFEEIKKLKDELYRENLALKEEIDHASMFEEIVGTSEGLRRVLVQVAKVAPADSSVLITGETGTGKELIARAIHKRSPRSSRAFIGVNCAAVPADLIGSELFGHEKGAFTGATQRRLGRFELSDGGTLFLDEVADLPAETQIALLRVLQERQFERVGGTQSIAVNVRIIAATNRDLKAAVAAGAFRSDLFYRLNVFPIAVPPLRERKDDIPLLVEYFIERYAGKAGKKINRIHKSTLELFKAYDWPGNIRELQNVIERAVILCEGGAFSVDQSWLQSEPPREARAGGALARPAPDQEKELIESALAETGGRIAGPSGAAAKLGIPRSTLETKIRKLGIKKHKFNPA